MWRWPCGWESAGDRGAAGGGVSPAHRHGPSRHRKTAHVPRHAPGHVQFLFQSLRFALSKQAKTARHRSGTRTTNSGFTRDRVAAWPYCKASLLCPGHPRSIHTPKRSQVTKETRELCSINPVGYSPRLLVNDTACFKFRRLSSLPPSTSANGKPT